MKKRNKFVKPSAGYNKKCPVFSFKFLHFDNKNYSIKEIKDFKIFHNIFERFKSMSQLTWLDIKNSHQFHAHEITWSKTSEPEGFKHLPKLIQSYPPFQFKIYKNNRIIGFFNKDNVFEIVWYDLYHRLYKCQ